MRESARCLRLFKARNEAIEKKIYWPITRRLTILDNNLVPARPLPRAAGYPPKSRSQTRAAALPSSSGQYLVTNAWYAAP